ncbi:hypothetical protein SGFS_065910 [Streptomyces graminofaciens]|uniref:Uncharacterized protein n=1 Tax=Streptomyces graminofaciens TaxID=68212 RepID=A0ABM7FGB2_9ACTN|nr:hypothetical protein [Streptomyces graminofaciens]BBC35297.1 hypothetical protein SGFS_065910 [Streptomyces graminofaciens]
MPSIAPFVSAFKRRLVNLPGPARASGEASNGEPVQVELWVNGEWVDITAGGYVMVRDDNGRINLKKGIRSEGAQTDAASSELELRNTDGRFSPRNPTGPYYGLLNRNQPIRISVPDGNGGKSYRLLAEVSDWAQEWERSGNDVWTTAELSGVIRRYAQAPPPERSVIYEAVTSPLASSVVAYWPCEDVSGSASIASAVTNGSPMVFSTGTPNLAASSLFTASDPLPTFAGASMTGGVAKYDTPTATQVRFLVYLPSAELTNRKVIVRVSQASEIATTPLTDYELVYNSTTHSLSVVFMDSSGTNFGVDLDHTQDVRDRLLYVSLEFQESGSSTIYTVRTLDIVNDVEVATSLTRNTEGLTRCTAVAVFVPSISAVGPNSSTGLAGGVVGHITVENAITAIDALGRRLNPVGEPAGRRIQRLCAENAIPFDWVGDLDDTVAMGGQSKQNPLALIRECVEADGGMLFENLAVHGLGYRTRASLYSQDPQLVLDYAGYNLAEVPVPVEDDQRIANRVTVTVNGVSQTYEETEGRLSTALPPAGVGVYGPSDATLNLATTDAATLLDQAAWRVHLGTVDEARHPQIAVNLAHSSFVDNPALKRAVLALRQGDRIQVQNPPAWLPPDAIDQLVLGFDESITHFEHRITMICAPASPYTVGYLDSVDSRVDTDGSETLTAISSSDTTVYVVPSAGQTGLWTTDTAEVPWDVRAGGEVMTVTSCTGWLVDAFGRSSSSSWGTADTGQAWATVGGGAASDYSVGSGYGVHVLSTVDTTRRTSVTPVSADCDFYGSITSSALATGSGLFGALTARMLDSENMYMARLEFTTSNAVLLVLRKLVANVGTDLGTYTVPVTHVAGTFIRVRFQLKGSALKVKAWLASEIEPPNWNIEVTDSSISATNTIGTRSIRVTGNTNAASVEIRYDGFEVINPQTWTVTRSVNGCVKAHAAGTDVRVANPWILPL